MDLATAIQQFGRAAVFIGAALEGETVLVLSGAAVRHGYLDPASTIALAALGGLFGDQVWFAVGRRYGPKLVRRWPWLVAPLSRSQRLVASHGNLLIVGMRFLYGLRIVAPIALGMSGIPWARFAALNFVGAVLWAPLFTGLGYAFAGTIQPLLHSLDGFGHWAFAVLVGTIAAWWLVRRFVARRER